MLLRSSSITLAALLAVGLGGCKLVKNADQMAESGGAARQESVDLFFEDSSFDPDKMARDLWDTKVAPYLAAKAGLYGEVRPLMASNPDEAGKRFGYREKAEGVPWNIIVRFDGKIVAANTQSRAATADVDIDGDGTADLTVQIGPVIKGTALRDSLDFVSFNAFINQIDFAQFAKSLNGVMIERALAKLPRDDLVGREISVVGVFPLERSTAKPLVTPAELKLRDRTS